MVGYIGVIGLVVSTSLFANPVFEAKGKYGVVKDGRTVLTCEAPRFTETGNARLCSNGSKEAELLLTQDDEAGALIIRANRQIDFYACEITWAGEAIESATCVPGKGSSFKSSARKAPVPNFHEIDKGLFRGAAPDSPEEIDALIPHKFENVIIFKTQSKKEIDTEIDALEEKLGLRRSKTPAGEKTIHWKKFPWKDHGDHVDTCKLTLEALQILVDNKASKTKTFFHCSVGEDRTGMLAGLYQVLKKPSHAKTTSSLQKLFLNEMCERGYEAGSPQKPYRNVVLPIREALTPLFLKLVTAANEGTISSDNLDLSVCDNLPEPSFDADEFVCETSTRFQVLADEE